MRVPNLSSRPFLNRRPVVVASATLAAVALVLSALNVLDILNARTRERVAAQEIASLEAKRAEMTRAVADLNRTLGEVGWRRLGTETASLQEVVARRKLAWSRFLAELERVLPWNIRLLSISPQVEKDGSVTLKLKGLATDREAWLHFLAVLFADRSFSDPVPESEELPGLNSPLGLAFSLSVRYWPEGRP